MSWRILVFNSRSTINKLNAILQSPFSIKTLATFPSSHLTRVSPFTRHLHSGQLSNSLIDPKLHYQQNDDVNDDGTTNEFLSRFVWIMRKKVREAYPNSDKPTVDGMLLVIVESVVSEMEKGSIGSNTSSFPLGDFSEDLWRTVWEVSNKVLEDMKKERKKEKLKGFLQCEEVKEMCRFAGEVGIRGDLLRELRFKWAREKMEEQEFYEGLERIRREAQTEEKEHEGTESKGFDVTEEKAKVVTLPKRRGKIRYKIYGLDLSDPKWAQVADRIHEAEQVFWSQEAKPITGKCKLVTEKIMSLKEEDDNLSTLLAEWIELLQPSRVDWINLLDRLKMQNPPLYFKVAEMVLTEDSFQTNVSDYSRLIDIYAKANQFDDAERILKKMNENGILPDASTASALVQMYSKGGNLERAKETFKILTSQGFQPDIKVYNSMIMAYVNAGEPKLGVSLTREMETRDIKPTKEIYMALLRSFSQRGDVNNVAQISSTMQFAGFQQSMETCTLLIEAHANAGDPDQARINFDYMIKLGHKPDDRCTASMIAAYEKKNLLDKALNLLLELENDGFEPGVATYSVLVDWFGKLQLVDEAEQIIGKISVQGEAPPFKVQVSLCDMYARAGNEKKTLQTLGVLEARKDELGPAEFERIISSLIAGGFEQDARRIYGVMEAQGFTASNSLWRALFTPGPKTPTVR
ncbi:pentatricopeptide repeat-containing protein At1g03560, mitochondrial [Gastrolobium bilobum]|uniref:pentatricopeptide repeat-containing protein At1g03560, mitochondrial n=1 Tax=Gastrolobium bilobum TaxID=150636 RepID=UPI002AAF10E1|nr:pentatricopeptide repeat-containing protein At1g03560, mitochondrial [Gastrolobium bilobum]